MIDLETWSHLSALLAHLLDLDNLSAGRGDHPSAVGVVEVAVGVDGRLDDALLRHFAAALVSGESHLINLDWIRALPTTQLALKITLNPFLVTEESVLKRTTIGPLVLSGGGFWLQNRPVGRNRGNQSGESAILNVH